MSKEAMYLVVLGGAILLDLLLGEPEERWHPVVWIGTLIEKLKSAGSKFQTSKIYGFLLLSVVLTATIFSSYLTVNISLSLLKIGGLLISIYLLTSTISVRGLFKEVKEVGEQIETHPELARANLKSLVGRKRDNLSKAQMRSAAIESLFENFTDSILTPLFFYWLGLRWGLGAGIALAIGYKSVNTLDSMIGYRTKNLKNLGFAGAKMDDLLNFIPARLTALLISLASLSKAALRIGRRDSKLTPSPNGGWAMGAGAGALEVKLQKPGVYTLGREYKLPKPTHINKALRKAKSALLIAVFCLGGMVWIWA